MSVKGKTPRTENQITCLRPKRSPRGPPASTPAAAASRTKEMHLCASDGNAEAMNEIERVVAREARQVDELGKNKHEKHSHRFGDFRGPEPRSRCARLAPAARETLQPMALVPDTHGGPRQDAGRKERQDGETRRARAGPSEGRPPQPRSARAPTPRSRRLETAIARGPDARPRPSAPRGMTRGGIPKNLSRGWLAPTRRTVVRLRAAVEDEEAREGEEGFRWAARRASAACQRICRRQAAAAMR